MAALQYRAIKHCYRLFKIEGIMRSVLADSHLTAEFIIELSKHKQEPQWMTDFRLQAFDIFVKKPMPTWAVDLSDLNFDELLYYVQPHVSQQRTWQDIPTTIKNTFDALGIV